MLHLLMFRTRRLLSVILQQWPSGRVCQGWQGVLLHLQHRQPWGHGGPEHPQHGHLQQQGVRDGGHGQDKGRCQGRNTHPV